MEKRFIGNPMGNNSEYEWDIYEETPKMPTYSLAFAVLSEHTSVETRIKNKTFRTWTFKENTNVNGYDDHLLNLNYTSSFYFFYENYFNLPDVLTKIDSLDSTAGTAGAMEGWGLTIYFEGLLNSQKTIAHELAHYWFGNRVTMKSWKK